MKELNLSYDSRWMLLGALIAIFISVPIEYTLSKVAQYEKDGYESYSGEYAIDLYSVFLKAKSECNKETTATDKNRCHETVAAITKRHMEPRDLHAQETMALATRGLMWVGAWQALFSLGALTLLGLTVYQTGRMVKQSQSASDYALQTLNIARDEYTCILVVIAVTCDVQSNHVGVRVNIRNEGRSEILYL